ncbi:MAG: FGGY-family carbohydrate kinase [Candidatus Odinarchaeota archaeon]
MKASKPENKCILAFDHGTSGVKAALVTVRGKVLDFVTEETPLYLKQEGGAEQDPAEWWQALVKASRRLIDKELVPVDDIIGIGVSSQWSGTVAVDIDGNHLFNAIIWLDSRGAKHLHKELRGFPKISGYPLKDAIRWIYKTGGAPLLSGKDPIAHVLFLKNEYPEIYQGTYMFLECKDYLNLRLTGNFAASFDSIILFWITNNRNINRIRYDKGLIKRLKLDRSKFPVLKSSVDILGPVSRDVADELGINPDVEVVVGSPDLQSAMIGSGAVRDYQGCVYIGTSSCVLCHVPFKKTDIFHNIGSIPSAIPGRYFLANEQESAGACLTFLRDRMFFTGDEKYQGNTEVYQMFDRIVETVPAGNSRVIFTPWLYGERTPVEDNTVRGGFHNVSLNTSKGDFIRSVYEGVAYNSRWVLQYVEAMIKRKMDTLNIIGGGAQSEVWCQIYADVLNRTIRQVKNPVQANARGAAFIASVGLGYITFEDIPGLIEYSRTFSPNPESSKIYEPLYKEFLEIYRNNRSMHHRLNKQ